jgi:hypothetical protein
MAKYEDNFGFGSDRGYALGCCELFLDDAARDPGAGVTGWIGFVIVRICVNH